jgi:hypothetical protein
MPTMLSPIRTVLTPVFHALVVAIFAAYAPSALAADALAASGVAMIPEDAAFVSATLRAREQYDRFEKSNAFAALKKLPFVVRGVDSIEEQKLQPGRPLSIMSTFMAKMLLTVSKSVSPFLTELPEAEKLMVSAESLFSANSKDKRVRVEFSKNTLAMVTSRKEGTFLMGRLRTSLNSLAVFIIKSIDSASKSLIPNRCGDFNIV